MLPHEIHIFHSEEDGGFIATVHELPGCSAFGKTAEEALEEVVVAAKLFHSPLDLCPRFWSIGVPILGSFGSLAI